eukprot:3931733-Prymnesium_polylepis.2
MRIHESACTRPRAIWAQGWRAVFWARKRSEYLRSSWARTYAGAPRDPGAGDVLGAHHLHADWLCAHNVQCAIRKHPRGRVVALAQAVISKRRPRPIEGAARESSSLRRPVTRIATEARASAQLICVQLAAN